MLNKVTHALLLFVFVFSLTPTTHAFDGKGTIELADQMRALQYYLHKTGLALDDQNQPLTSYYLRKLEEKTAVIERFGATYNTTLIRSSQRDFRPPLQRLRERLGNVEWELVSQSYDEVIDGCNRCHISTGVEFIRVRRTFENLFMQNFALSKTRIIKKRSIEEALLYGTPSLPTEPNLQAPLRTDALVAEHYAIDSEMAMEEGVIMEDVMSAGGTQ